MRWLLLLFCWKAHANFQQDLIKGRRAGTSGAVQWTLADWITQKNRIALMDQWLALNRSSDWIEIVPSAGFGHYSLRTIDPWGNATVVSGDAQRFSVDVNASILSLQAEYEKLGKTDEYTTVAAGLRLLGASAQSTSLTARYGYRRLRDTTTDQHVDNPFVEGAAQLYLFKPFGLIAQYRKYFEARSNWDVRTSGERLTTGVFLEVVVFRLYFNFVREPMRVRYPWSDDPATETRDAWEGGLRLFF